MQEKLVANNDYLKKLAKDAYKSYIVKYKSHCLKEIFNVRKLDLKVYISSYYLSVSIPTITTCFVEWIK